MENPDNSLAVVAVSGGLDSAVATAIAAEKHELALMHINYGNKTQKRELEAFHAIADFYKIDNRFVADIDHLRKIGGSSLTDRNMEVADYDPDVQGIPQTYVPFRNANILSIAVSWGEAIGANLIYVGMMEEDSAGYPDCTEEFINAFNTMVKVGTRPETNIELIAPLIHMSKGEVIKRGMELGAPLELTWSCYRNEEESCGECESCVLRINGYQELGIDDPIKYVEMEGKGVK
ncbi:7-cyano-7-deazaguanine synthase QueC [Candidatus Marinimicrobia bacterium MT.SAG.4]|nr:7-cyano-7-deazaguanine synthase QueC [Candidatus Marinimicrobia bacterium MT.SAG.4]